MNYINTLFDVSISLNSWDNPTCLGCISFLKKKNKLLDSVPVFPFSEKDTVINLVTLPINSGTTLDSFKSPILSILPPKSLKSIYFSQFLLPLP